MNTAFAVAGNMNVQNIVQNVNILAVAGSGGAGMDNPAPPRGWPQKWPAPTAELSPFDPPQFVIPLDVLKRALATGVKDAAACMRGDPAAVAQLLVEIVKHVQENPRERNIYIDPKRADQVLVYVPERWEVRPLLGAIKQVLGHAASELVDIVLGADRQLKNLAKTTGECFQNNSEIVVKSSQRAMTTHLLNMQLRLGSSECWLGDCLTGPTAVRVFCRERHGHLEEAAVVEALGRAIGVFGEADLAGKTKPEMARQAMMMFARMRLAGRPENLTAVLLGDGTALVRAARGWETRDATQAAAEQAADVARKAAAFMQDQPDVKYLLPLAEYMRENADALAAEEAGRLTILMQCSLAAERHYGRTPDEEHAEIRARLLRYTKTAAPRALERAGRPFKQG